MIASQPLSLQLANVKEASVYLGWLRLECFLVDKYALVVQENVHIWEAPGRILSEVHDLHVDSQQLIE